MNKLFLTSIAALAISVPAIADPVSPNIAVGTNPASCTESVLETTSGTSNLEANWTANTLNLKWYDDVNGNEINPTNPTASTCTYDSGITVPSNTISKTGYTFAGWQVKVAPAGFDLSTLNASIPGTSYSYIGFNGKASIANSNGTRKVPSAHSITENGEWATEFSYGTVKGISRCSLVGSGYTEGQTGDPTDDLNTKGAGYCWCQVTGFDDDKDGTYQSVVSSLWAFYFDCGSAASCASTCTGSCGRSFRDYVALRAGLFGTAQ